jgi:hypothetical protein
MNAFISYSIYPNEQYLLTLLAQKLSERGLSSVTSYNQGNFIDGQTLNEIQNAALFIGLITWAGNLRNPSRVFLEFDQANLYSKPSILLIEDNVYVTPQVAQYPNTIRFSRDSIHQAIEEVNRRILDANAPLTSQNAMAWILGGIGVLAILALLSSDKK